MSGTEIPFGERLERWLAVLGMRQVTFARALGVSAPTVHGWLSGRESPRIDRLSAIAAALGVSLTEFFGALPETALLARPDAPAEAAEEELPPHPSTGDITRDFGADGIEQMLNRRGPCATCGRNDEVA